MRIGVLGLGRIGAFHAETLADIDGVELVVNDARTEVTEAVGAKLGVATAASPEEATEVLRRCAGARVQIGYNRRFDPGFVAARAAVQAGDLGRIHTVRSTTLDPAPPPAEYLAASGGIFHDCSVHDFDIIRFVTGREVVEVYATGLPFPDSDDVSSSAAILTLDDGALVVVSNSRFNARGYDVRLELHGTVDSIAAGWDSGLPLRSVEPGVDFPGGSPHQFFMDRFATAYRRELAAFLELVAGERESPCTVADAVEASWIAEAATRSLQAHRPIRMSEVRP